MANLNKVLLMGRITQDIDKRVTPQGQSVATVNLATNEKFTDKQGNKQESTEFHRVVFWDKLADLVSQYCKKGSGLYVEGSIQTKEWKDKEGNKRWTTEINGRNMQFLDSRGQSNQGGGHGQLSRQPETQGQGIPGKFGPSGEDGYIDDQIPF